MRHVGKIVGIFLVVVVVIVVVVTVVVIVVGAVIVVAGIVVPIIKNFLKLGRTGECALY